MSKTAKSPVDVFEKARSHDRLEQLEAAKEHDLLPYFRLLTSQAGPVVEMEGRGTIMLGSQNYLRPTGGGRGKQAAPGAPPNHRARGTRPPPPPPGPPPPPPPGGAAGPGGGG